MIGKVPFGVAGTSPFIAVGIFLFTEIPSLEAEAVEVCETGSISVVASAVGINR